MKSISRIGRLYAPIANTSRRRIASTLRPVQHGPWHSISRSGTSLIQHRFYSTPTNPNENENGKKPKEISPEDRELIQKLKETVKGVGMDDSDAFIQYLEKNGIPDDLRPLLKKAQDPNVGVIEKISLLGQLIKPTIRLAHRVAEEEAADKNVASKRTSEDQKPEGTAQKPETPEEQTKEENQKESEESKSKFNFNANQETKGNEKGNKQKKTTNQFVLKTDFTSLIISSIIFFYFTSFLMPSESSKEITWQEFRTTFLEKGLVEKIVVLDHATAKVYLRRENLASISPDSPAINPNFYYYFTIGSVESFERRLDQAQNELEIPSNERIPVAYEATPQWAAQLLYGFAPTILFLAGIAFLSRRAGGAGGGTGGIFGMGRSRAKMFNHETEIKVKFADVAGMDEAKAEIMEFVSFLKEPAIYQKLGAKIPRGAILSGPPGTGKTLLAKATAGESGVPFFSVSGSEFVEMFVGVGASRVRDLFSTARKNAPCIIFIDEIDAIGRSRTNKSFGGNEERETTLNQILTEMDGFNTSEQVVVMAGTNRVDVLDQALLRPGRFDRNIVVDKPTMQGRQQIFGVHLKKIVTHEDLENLKGRLATLTPGFSGADIANCVNEAALIAARKKADSVKLEHFEQAIERVIGGLERRSLVLSPEEKRIVAYHEAGHAICGWFFKWADPLLKVSIIPRGQGALGYAQYVPKDGDTYLMNAQQLMDRMAMTLGGRVSEELHFETVTSGASDDFKKVTHMATAMVTRFGMSERIGPISFDDDGQQQFQKPFSEETGRAIDSEVRRIVGDAYKQCRDLLESKKKEVGLVAEELLRKEMLTRDDMIRLLGKRPFDDKGEFHKYFDGTRSELPPTPRGTPGAPPLDLPPNTQPPPTPAFRRWNE